MGRSARLARLVRGRVGARDGEVVPRTLARPDKLDGASGARIATAAVGVDGGRR